MITITIANQKGGVGKTTTAVTLAHGLARRGYRTLLIDLDGQGNVADCLGLAARGDLYRWLFPGERQSLAQVSRPTRRENLDVIRSDKSTSTLKVALAGMDFREYVLAEALNGADYDVVIMDCAPSIDLLHTAAMVAADYLFVPTKLDQLAAKGVRDVLSSLHAVQQNSRSSCRLLGILPTFYERVTRESHEQLKHLVKAFGKSVFPPIPQDTNCRVASRFGQTLWEYDPGTRALVGINNAARKPLGGYAQTIERIQRTLQ